MLLMEQINWKQILSCTRCFAEGSSKMANRCLLHIFDKTPQFMQIFSCDRCVKKLFAQTNRLLVKLMFCALFWEKKPVSSNFRVEPAVWTSFCSNSAISRQFYVFCTFLTKNSNFKQTTQLRRLFLTILTENGLSMFSAYFWQTKAIKANLQLDALSCLRLSLNRALSVRFLENNFISSKITVVHAI